LLPGHNGLWKSAQLTSDCLLSRLGIVHMVLEGRGLDVTPSLMKKLENSKDVKSLNLLKIIYRDEIGHVKAGIKWFKYVCKNSKIKTIDNPINEFHRIVRTKFFGSLKPPFNTEARKIAGFTEEWYLPLAKPMI